MSDDPIPPIVIPPEGDEPTPDAGTNPLPTPGSGGGGHTDPDKPGK